jgi:EEF1A N-terminal glycine/lysine methyltransferase
MDAEDFSLTALFPPSSPPPPDEAFSFGSLALSIPSRSGKAITLLADQIFNPGLVLAEQIDTGLIDVVGKSGNNTWP